MTPLQVMVKPSITDVNFRYLQARIPGLTGITQESQIRVDGEKVFLPNRILAARNVKQQASLLLNWIALWRHVMAEVSYKGSIWELLPYLHMAILRFHQDETVRRTLCGGIGVFLTDTVTISRFWELSIDNRDTLEELDALEQELESNLIVADTSGYRKLVETCRFVFLKRSDIPDLEVAAASMLSTQLSLGFLLLEAVRNGKPIDDGKNPPVCFDCDLMRPIIDLLVRTAGIPGKGPGDFPDPEKVPGGGTAVSSVSGNLPEAIRAYPQLERELLKYRNLNLLYHQQRDKAQAAIARLARLEADSRKTGKAPSATRPVSFASPKEVLLPRHLDRIDKIATIISSAKRGSLSLQEKQAPVYAIPANSSTVFPPDEEAGKGRQNRARRIVIGIDTSGSTTSSLAGEESVLGLSQIGTIALLDFLSRQENPVPLDLFLFSATTFFFHDVEHRPQNIVYAEKESTFFDIRKLKESIRGPSVLVLFSDGALDNAVEAARYLHSNCPAVLEEVFILTLNRQHDSSALQRELSKQEANRHIHLVKMEPGRDALVSFLLRTVKMIFSLKEATL